MVTVSAITIHGSNMGDKAPQFLPYIFPVILYHGADGWNRSTAFNILFEENLLFKAYTPDFQFHLCDLHPMTDDQIIGSLLTKAVFITLKSVYEPDFVKVLPKLLQFVKTIDSETTGLQCLEAFLKYILCASKNLEVEQLKGILENAIPDKGGTLMATIAETLIKKGEELGIKKGEEAMKKTVKNMLKKGFALEIISQIIELSIDDVKKLAAQS